MRIHVTNWNIKQAHEGPSNIIANPPGKLVSAQIEKEFNRSWLRLVTVEEHAPGVDEEDGVGLDEQEYHAPWWAGKCAAIANYINNLNDDYDLTAAQVEQVMMYADRHRP